MGSEEKGEDFTEEEILKFEVGKLVGLFSPSDEGKDAHSRHRERHRMHCKAGNMPAVVGPNLDMHSHTEAFLKC